MKVTKTTATTSLAVLLALVASGITAAISSGAIISAYAQQESAIDIEIPQVPELPPIPQLPEEAGEFIPCLPPPECLLPGAEVCAQVCWPFPEPEE
jgi:hypothetical protein